MRRRSMLRRVSSSGFLLWRRRSLLRRRSIKRGCAAGSMLSVLLVVRARAPGEGRFASVGGAVVVEPVGGIEAITLRADPCEFLLLFFAWRCCFSGYRWYGYTVLCLHGLFNQDEPGCRQGLFLANPQIVHLLFSPVNGELRQLPAALTCPITFVSACPACT